MDQWAKFLCRLLGHHRDGYAIQFNSIEQRYEGACKRCRIRMVRTSEGKWTVAGKADARAMVTRGGD